MVKKEYAPERHAEHAEKVRHESQTRMKPAEYLRQVKAHLRSGKQRDAFILLQQSTMHFPNEPVLLSYYGCLLALVEKKYRLGIETCLKALEKLQIRASFDEEVLYPIFYFNLGRAYAAAGKRKESLGALNKGLSYDPGNNEIMKELRSMGMRNKKPPIPFLDRSNPLNKYLGIALYKGKVSSHEGKKRVSVL